MLHHNPGSFDSRDFPNHSDSMFMDVLGEKDRKPGIPRIYGKNYQQSLRTDDIEGSNPTYPYQKLYKSGPPSKEFVPGSQAKTYYPAQQPSRRPIDGSLRTRDIEKAQPNVIAFK